MAKLFFGFYAAKCFRISGWLGGFWLFVAFRVAGGSLRVARGGRSLKGKIEGYWVRQGEAGKEGKEPICF